MINGLPESRGVTAPLHSDAWYQAVAANFAATIPAFWWAKGQWRWFRCYTLMFWIAMTNLLPEFLISPGPNNFATMNPTANIVCSGLALAANVALFAYWLYVVTIKRRNPVTTGIFQELAEYRTIAKEHFTDADKHWIVDMIPETPAQLGLEPDSDTPPADGFVTRMPWWGKEDKRYPKLRTPVSADPVLVAKGVQSDPQWDVTATAQTALPKPAQASRR